MFRLNQSYQYAGRQPAFLQSFFEDLQDVQEVQALQVVQEKQEKMALQEVPALQVVQGKQEKMVLREVQEEMAETEGMVHREPEVF
jgi:hypothetical protein